MLDAIVVGGGLAGLCCARHLQTRGWKVLLLEVSDGVGGRVRTDVVQGFRLDRGFQVLLDRYPEVEQQIQLSNLRLRPFLPGALVRCEGAFHEVSDPWRRPWSLLSTLHAPIGTWRDKLLMSRLKARSLRGTIEERFHDPEQSTLQVLRDIGFSATMIDRFFRPFLGGIFLDGSLDTSSRMLDFVFRMFSRGAACLPEAGMEAIPRQLATALQPGTIRLETRVEKIHEGSVVVSSGERMSARCIFVAVEGPSAGALLGAPKPMSGRGVMCFYYAAKRSPLGRPLLVLNGEGHGPINNLCVPSDVCPSYSPAGRSLISASVLQEQGMDAATIEPQVRLQLREWFGAVAEDWEPLRSYTVPYALPAQPVSWLEPHEREVRVQKGVYVCGDHRDQGSIQGAMVSGRRAAEAAIADTGTRT